MSDNALKAILEGGENLKVEFKSGVGDINSIARTICAFLNCEGGAIYCGVDDGGHALGVDVTPDGRRELEEALQRAITPAALFTVAIDTIDDGGVDILTIDVPPGKDTPYIVDGGVWLRVEDRTLPADAAALRKMFAVREEERWERRWSSEMLSEDIDRSEVRALVDATTANGKYAFKSSDQPIDILRRLGLVRAEGVTNAGDVLFAKEPSIRHPQCRVQFIRYATSKTDDEYVDYRWFEGPLCKVANEVLSALYATNSVRAIFKPGEIERTERRAYDGYALREGLVNALAHRDYASYSGGVKVSVYPDRVEYWNSGRLPEGIQPSSLARHHQPKPINPDIVHVLYLREFMERTGRGTERLAAACEQIGAPMPRWRDGPDGVTLTIFAALSSNEAQKTFNARQRAFADTVKPGQEVTLSDYWQRFAKDVTERQARRDLEDLVNNRFLRKQGAGRATVYRRSDT